jgi:methionyl-tRNA formyltransferase
MVTDTPRLRVAFFGTPAFAAPTLAALLDSRHQVVGVVTQPDRPRGRGQKPTLAPVKQLALERGLPVLQPEKLKDPAFLEAFAAWGADLGVVAAYGRIIPEIVIGTPPLGLINVHASLLPRYRGAAPVHRAVLAGDTVTGVTIMRIVRELDAGAMFARVERPIPPDATSEDVERDLAGVGAPLLVDVVDAIAGGHAHEEPQDDDRATYAAKITREEGLIDWTRPAAAIHNQVRGLWPWPHAWTFLDRARLIVRRTTVVSTRAGGEAPGTVTGASGDRWDVACGEGVVRLVEVQPEGRRAMKARDFLAGHPVPPGTVVG